MGNDKHYNPAIGISLQAIVGNRDWLGLLSYLDTLSNAQFRTAGYMLGEQFAPLLSEEDFWKMSSELVLYNSRAFLVTMTKAARMRLSDGTLHLHTDGVAAFGKQLRGNETDVKKTLQQLLPVIKAPNDIEWLMNQLGVENGRERAKHLLRVETPAAAFVLCRSLRYVEHDRPFLIRVATFLVKRGDGLGFNIASFLRTLYALEEVKGTFSLRLQPYQLARLETSYPAFCEVVKF